MCIHDVLGELLGNASEDTQHYRDMLKMFPGMEHFGASYMYIYYINICIIIFIYIYILIYIYISQYYIFIIIYNYLNIYIYISFSDYFRLPRCSRV